MANFEISALTKLYYSIGEVAKIFDVNASLLRFWEKEFDIQIAKKNKKGNRLYSVKEIAVIHTIYDFVKLQGYTIEGAKRALKGNHPIQLKEKDTNERIIEQLEKIKQKLQQLKS
jgi:DNA-binding transcriptional MerR regulator